MSAESTPTGQWLEENNGAFEQASGLAAEIGKQNILYADFVESGHPALEPVREVAGKLIVRKQCETFAALANAQDEAPYAALAERELRAYNALNTITKRLFHVEEVNREAFAPIRHIGALLAGRLPQIAYGVANLEQEFIASQTAKLRAQQDDLAAEYATTTSAFEEIGKAWPIPGLLSKEENNESPVIETAQTIEKVTPATTHEQQSVCDPRNYPEVVLRDASTLVALFLAKEPGRDFTLQELAAALYDDDVNNGASRVSALLSNYTLGKVPTIGNSLTERGLILQRGQRNTTTCSTETAGRSSIVYRAVSPNNQHLQEQAVTNGTVEQMTENWRTITPTEPHPTIKR